MLNVKVRKFLKPMPLNKYDKIYLDTKGCSCNACVAYKKGFKKECPKEKLDYLEYMSRV